MRSLVRIAAASSFLAIASIVACSDSDQPAASGGPLADAAAPSFDANQGADSNAGSPPDAGGGAPDGSPPDGSPPDGSLDAGVTVTGKALDLYYRPWPGTVTVGSTTVAVAADGSFTVPGVTVPYDAIVVSTDKKLAYAVLGVTRTNPILAGSLAPTPRSEPTVSGALPAALASGEYARVHVEIGADPDWGLSFSTSFSPSATYSVFPSWPGAASEQGTVWAFKYTTNDVQHVATSFLGYASASKTIAPTGTTTVDLAAYNAVGTATIGTSVTVPATYSLYNEFGVVRMASSTARQVINQYTGSSLTATMAVPDAPGATFFASVGSQGPAGEFVRMRRTVAKGGTATLNVPSASNPTAPADGATGIAAGATLSWTVGAGVSEIEIIPAPVDGGTAGPELRILTSSSSVKLPDFAAAGLTFPVGASYSWDVNRFDDHASIDDVTAATVIDWYCSEASSFLGDDCTNARGSSRQFTMP
jgi:hypothetical protein